MQTPAHSSGLGVALRNPKRHIIYMDRENTNTQQEREDLFSQIYSF